MIRPQIKDTLLFFKEGNRVFFINKKSDGTEDWGLGSYCSSMVAMSIDSDNPDDIVFFTANDKKTITHRKFDNIANKAGDLYATVGSTAKSVFLALNLVDGTVEVSSSGSGGATEANQDLQTTELTSIKNNQLSGDQKTQIQGTVTTALPADAATASSQALQTTELTSIKNNQTNGGQITLDYVLAASFGLVTGASVIGKVGFNPDVDIITDANAQIAAAGGGSYTGFVATAQTVQIVSSNNGDVGTVYFQYLESAASTNYIEGSINITGTAPVTTTFTAYRIHTAYYKPTNGNAYNLGTITIRQSATPTNIFALMLPYTNQTNTGVYTVPAGKKANVLAATLTIGNATGGAGSYVKGTIAHKPIAETAFRRRRPVLVAFTSVYTDPPTVSTEFAAGTDIAFKITTANTANTEVVFSATILLRPA